MGAKEPGREPGRERATRGVVEHEPVALPKGHTSEHALPDEEAGENREGGRTGAALDQPGRPPRTRTVLREDDEA